MSRYAPAEGAPLKMNGSAPLNGSIAPSSASPSERGLRALAFRFWHSWATRSLAVGAVATVLDIVVLVLLVHYLGWANPVAAMAGVMVGSTFTFFANRHFAFRDHHPEVAPQVFRFVVATFVGMVAHALVVHVFADRMGVPVVLAKLGADLCVFTFGQLLVLRYFVFPKNAPLSPAPAPATPTQSDTHPAPAWTP
ncbi:MAG: GtrA family protein [Myxococcaceae bacterium]|nr:GtrA family protein [Myxococcaceae bacterium]